MSALVHDEFTVKSGKVERVFFPKLQIKIDGVLENKLIVRMKTGANLDRIMKVKNYF